MVHFQRQMQKNDEYYTPPYAVYPIMGRLKAGAAVWCPFDKADSEFVKILSGNGFKVTYGHIQTGQDFFHTEVPDCDYIVSNPPYSLKGEVLKRLYEIGKPFAMLINFQGIFDSRDRFRMFKENRVEMLWLSPRVYYMTADGGTPAQTPFQSGYLCSGICENQLEFDYLDVTSPRVTKRITDTGRNEVENEHEIKQGLR